ncbi:MAG: helix-turn-helix domain-containing protein [Candidatus Paceibacteria bacterium]
MDIEIALEKLLNFYNIKTLTQLADKLNTNQSTISGWRSRQAFGTLIEKVLQVDEQALFYIFNNELINDSNLKISEEVLINSIEFRIINKMKTEYSNFQQEIILLNQCLKENIEQNFRTRDDLVNLIKKYNIRIFTDTLQHMITEKHRNNVISFLYTFDDIEINYICNNLKNFITFLKDNITWYNKFFSFNKK